MIASRPSRSSSQNASGLGRAGQAARHADHGDRVAIACPLAPPNPGEASPNYVAPERDPRFLAGRAAGQAIPGSRWAWDEHGRDDHIRIRRPAARKLPERHSGDHRLRDQQTSGERAGAVDRELRVAEPEPAPGQRIPGFEDGLLRAEQRRRPGGPASELPCPELDARFRGQPPPRLPLEVGRSARRRSRA